MNERQRNCTDCSCEVEGPGQPHAVLDTNGRAPIWRCYRCTETKRKRDAIAKMHEARRAKLCAYCGGRVDGRTSRPGAWRGHLWSHNDCQLQAEIDAEAGRKHVAKALRGLNRIAAQYLGGCE